MSDDVQTEGAEAPEVQGAEDEASGLYDLTSVPDELKPHLEPHLKAIEGNVTRKFQEYSEKVKGWEPYEELGVNDIDPETLGGLLEFAELANDPEQFSEWWKETGERLGLFDGIESDEDEDDDLYDEDDDFDLEGLTPEKVQKLVADAVTENLSPLYEQMERSEQERAEQAMYQEITDTLDEIVQEHGEVDTDAVLQLAFAYVDDDPDNAIQKGFADYQRLVSAGEARLFNGKANSTGAGAEPEGAASLTPEPAPNDFRSAKQQAIARMKESTAS